MMLPSANMIVPTIFSLLCAAAGWYYLLHAGGAAKLAAMERPADNQLRIRLRRWGGAGLVIIAAAFYIGLRIADRRGNPISVMICLTAVMLLLPGVLFLAYVDLRLTRKMQDANRGKKKQ